MSEHEQNSSPSRSGIWAWLTARLVAALGKRGLEFEVASPEVTRRAVPTLFIALTVGFLLWGPEGNAWPLRAALTGMAPATFGAASFAFGALVMVGLPLLLLAVIAGDSPKHYGFDLGDFRRGLPITVLVIVCSYPVMAQVAKSPEFAAEYPLYDPGEQLLFYEASYLLFFIAVEGAIRGLLLFGVRRHSGQVWLALLVSTLVQTLWHLDKPLGELLAAPVWGLVVGILCLRLGSVWYAVLFHYASNVFLDLFCL